MNGDAGLSRGSGSWWQRLLAYGEFIKWSHTVFALPFALASMLVAARGLPTWGTALLILVCMVTARTAAMSFNRWADWEFDRLNPRTQGRQWLATRPTALVVTMATAGLFWAASALLNPLCGALAPLALGLILGYSWMKRVTSFSHAVLGLALAAAPMGAWAAVAGNLDHPAPWFLAAGVWAWVFGFDLIYATLDAEFDRSVGLRSFPARFGIESTVLLARGLHLAAWLLFAVFGLVSELGGMYWLAWAGCAGGLVYEHLLVRSREPERINRAFFEVNAVVSIMMLCGTGAGIWMR